VVEGTSLENWRRVTLFVSSNLTASAIPIGKPLILMEFILPNKFTHQSTHQFENACLQVEFEDFFRGWLVIASLNCGRRPRKRGGL
jgi:hypothetical protein